MTFRLRAYSLFPAACLWFLWIFVSSINLQSAAPDEEARYLPGGPLAGLVLPQSPQNTGSGPEVELFPGSVEHWRGNMMKYVPMRSFFDAQSQLKRWLAADLPGIGGDRIREYASPVYKQPKNGKPIKTEKSLPPVKVVDFSAKDPALKLDLGELDPGLYALRLIGAVPTDKLRPFRSPLILRLKINDKLDGSVSEYRVLAGYVDEFYNVATFYFHALDRRNFTAEVSVEKESGVALLLHDISLDDVLAGTDRRAIKTKRTLTLTPEKKEDTGDTVEGAEAKGDANPDPKSPAAKLLPLTPEQRLARDEALWNWLPPLNTPVMSLQNDIAEAIAPGVPGKTLAQIEAEYGTWEAAGHREMGIHDLGTGFPRDPAQQNAFIVNKKLGLSYTMDDLRARKPLPDPYPYKDDGMGLYFLDSEKPEAGHYLAPIAREAGRRYRMSTNPGGMSLGLWKTSGNPDFQRDAAISLIRYAFQYPTIEYGNFLNSLIGNPISLGRDNASRQRDGYAMWMSHYPDYIESLRIYDELFDSIKGNEDLAKSVGRFIPWVKTSDDVIELLDVYLAQTTAKRILRYHYVSGPTRIADVAILLVDPKVTAPMMDWLFSRTWVYPLELAGIQELLVSSCDRSGMQYIGSSFYAQAQGAANFAEPLMRYVEAGGDARYSLSNVTDFPKTLAHADWQIDSIVGGQDILRIGDVTGPDKSPGAGMTLNLEEKSRLGWKLSSGPRFAWTLANVFGRKDESDAEWKKITTAAATLKRAPWLDLPSRHLENWATILESGLAHDDYRFRRAAYLRTGVGFGHAHSDTLDLQFTAHGLPMTIDGGQRSGYSKPNDRFSRLHNTVEVNGAGNNEYGLDTYAWPTALTDVPGARYMAATAIPPDGARIFRRQVALIDVDEGTGSEPLSLAQQKPRATLKPGVVTGNSYIFDVFRVSGGAVHTYCFHGPVNEDFQWNAANLQPVESIPPQKGTETEPAYLYMFSGAPESKQAGDAPETLQATWKYLRNGKVGSEQTMLGKSFDPASPPKFTRLTLLGAGGLRALKADVVCSREPIPYRFTNAMFQRKDAAGKLESAFTAIIEPYAGKPFIASSKLLPVADNEDDALRAVAVEVQTTNGHTDLVFADGRPEKTRSVQAAGFTLQVSAEFALASKDKDGLRLATLTGGTLLQTPDITLKSAQREYTAVITKVDYPAKTFWTDKPLPAGCVGRLIEIGPPGTPSAFTIATISPEGAGSRITLTRSADFYRSVIRKFLPEVPGVNGTLDFPHGRVPEGMTLSNDALTKFWRVGKRIEDCSFPVDAPLTEADFGPSKTMRLWEYGVGDTIRLSSLTAVNRIKPGTYEVRGDGEVEIIMGKLTRKIRAKEFARGVVTLEVK